MANQLYGGIKKLTDTIITDLSATPARRLVVPNCMLNSYNQGIDIEEVFASSPLGEDTLVDLFPTQRNPTISVTFPKKTPETLGMKLGYRFEQSATMDVRIARNGFLVEANAYDPATLGFEGYNVALDATAYASYLDPSNISVPLTQLAYTGFDPVASTLSFAVGADGALAFSDDLNGLYITYDIEATWTTKGLELTENLFDRFSVAFVMVQNDLSILRLEFPEVVIDPSDGDISFEDATMPVTFRPVFNGSGCVPVKIKYIDQKRKCLNAA